MSIPSSPSGNGSAGPPSLAAGPLEVTEETGAALVQRADYLLWVVDNKKQWLELLEEDVPVPIFTAREVLTLFPSRKAEFDVLFRVKKAIPGSRMIEFRPLEAQMVDIDPEND